MVVSNRTDDHLKGRAVRGNSNLEGVTYINFFVQLRTLSNKLSVTSPSAAVLDAPKSHLCSRRRRRPQLSPRRCIHCRSRRRGLWQARELPEFHANVLFVRLSWRLLLIGGALRTCGPQMLWLPPEGFSYSSTQNVVCSGNAKIQETDHVCSDGPLMREGVDASD